MKSHFLSKITGIIKLFIIIIPITLLNSQTKDSKEYDAFLILNQLQNNLLEAISRDGISELTSLLNTASSNTIFIDRDELFDDVINKTEQFYVVDKLVENTNDLSLQIAYCKFQFVSLKATQFKLQDAYSRLLPKEKFTSSILYLSTLRDISRKKTELLFDLINLLNNENSNLYKKEIWYSVGRMLLEIDIKASETGDKEIQHSPYGLMVKPNQVFPLLEYQKNRESDSSVKQLADQIITRLKAGTSIYIKRDEESIVLTPEEFGNSLDEKYKSALEYFNNALSAVDPEEQKKLYTFAIKQNARFTEAYINRGIIYYENEMYDSAYTDFEKASQLKPNSEDILIYLGMCKQKIKEYENAKKYFIRALLINPVSQLANLHLGIAYQQLKDYKNAMQNYNNIIEQDSLNLSALVNGGICSQKLKDNKKAITLLEKAVKLVPDNHFVLYNLGRIYWEQKDWGSVIKYWSKIEKKDFTMSEKFNKAKRYLLENKSITK